MAYRPYGLPGPGYGYPMAASPAAPVVPRAGVAPYAPRPVPFGGPYAAPALPVPGEPALKRQRMDAANAAPAYTPHGPQVTSQGKRSLEDFVESFAKDPSSTMHSFDASLTSGERRIIHQACLKWKLFSKSRGTGADRCLVISKAEIPLEDAAVTTESATLDPAREHINAPLKAWLDAGAAGTLTLHGVATKLDLRYVYQLATTFGFHPASAEGGTVQCTKLSSGDEGKMFSYKTLFTSEMVDVKALSSVLDDVQKPCAARCAVSLTPGQAALLGRTIADPDILRVGGEASKLGTPRTEERDTKPITLPKAGVTFPVNEELRGKLQAFRESLPIAKVRPDIVQALRAGPLLVLSGQTGSGKTTQVPQFVLDGDLLPAGSPVVLCTQPRRIAAISVADRIAQERGQAVGQEVGYQVRFDSASCPDTRLLFVTPGILFRRIQSDPNLTGVGAVIVDEVHERDVYTDFALLLIKRMLLERRCGFKVVLMSATLQAEGFARYFAEAVPGGRSAIPYLNVEGRLFPVKDYYLEDALRWTGFELNQLQDAVRREGKEVLDCNSILSADLTELQAATTRSATQGVQQVLPRLTKALKKPYELAAVLTVTPLAVTKGEKYAVTARLELPSDRADWREVELELYRTELGQTNLTKVKTLASGTPAPDPGPAPAAAPSPTPSQTAADSNPTAPEEPSPATATDDTTAPPAAPSTDDTSPSTNAPTSAMPNAPESATEVVQETAPQQSSPTETTCKAPVSIPGLGPPPLPGNGTPTSPTALTAADATSTALPPTGGAPASAAPAPPEPSTPTSAASPDSASSSRAAGYVVPKPHCALIAALVYFFHAGKQDGGILVFLPGMADIKDVEWALRQNDKVRELWVLKLHSGLPPAEQRRVFDAPPVSGLRKVVLSTNMAESSVTIEDIVFVIDSGLMKEKHYSANSNVTSLDCQFVSQVNVVQRRGRAGRVRAGVAVHLFPRAHYARLGEYPVPELCRSPLEDVCLMVKSIGVDRVDAFLQAAMDPPAPSSVENAVQFLRCIKALAPTETNDITALGYLLSTFPVSAQHGRLLLFAALLGVLHPVATVVAALTQRSPFNLPFDDATRKRLQAAKDEFRAAAVPSDHVLLCRAVQAWEAAPNRAHFAESHCMSNAALNAIRSTREQLLTVVLRAVGWDRAFTDRHAQNLRLVAACTAMGLYPNVAWKSPESFSHESAEKAKRTLTTPDGHRANIGRDSINFEEVPGPQDFLTYFERVSHRGTLVLQDSTVTGPLPLLLACSELRLRPGGGPPVLRADDVLEVGCTAAVGSLIIKLHDALQGALYLVATGASTLVPRQLLESTVTLVSDDAVAAPAGSVAPAAPLFGPRPVTTPVAPALRPGGPLAVAAPHWPPAGLGPGRPYAAHPAGPVRPMVAISPVAAARRPPLLPGTLGPGGGYAAPRFAPPAYGGAAAPPPYGGHHPYAPGHPRGLAAPPAVPLRRVAPAAPPAPRYHPYPHFH